MQRSFGIFFFSRSYMELKSNGRLSFENNNALMQTVAAPTAARELEYFLSLATFCN
jgi:hypothetical protein